jgi:glycyl-tRNA synthetase
MCITVDFESLENKTVTIRDRDSMAQSRIDISDIPSFVESKIKS